MVQTTPHGGSSRWKHYPFTNGTTCSASSSATASPSTAQNTSNDVPRAFAEQLSATPASSIRENLLQSNEQAEWLAKDAGRGGTGRVAGGAQGGRGGGARVRAGERKRIVDNMWKAGVTMNRDCGIVALTDLHSAR
ncbi:uncharacterized protein A4U43_C04F35490 [Asparagus officinalis]|uniref:Uncharacterized protein n=1 Tax=Asparagus officinalis TaxID=4686 RepID=A0A5P1F612_ASPOF|nr:uncharacterized protein A4U43_C04F35490 [Asparagus officinalis]